MRLRCSSPKHSDYGEYGARGIFVCEDWNTDFAKFRAWAEDNGYKPGLLLDRFDNDDGYYPDNCRFVSPKVSANNTRRNIHMTAFGETKTLAEWTEDERCVVKYATLYYRFQQYWNSEKALTTPSRQGN